VAVEKLERDFGSWKTPWGDINRFQRLTGDIVQPFNDAGPSIPVGFTSSRWGSLASFGARPYAGTKKWYGTSGNSFVAVVDFGKTVRARAVTAGGESGNPSSPHFDDQAERYAAGDAIFKLGDECSSLFLIEDGAVEISYGAGIAKVTLATLYNGQYFGELSLFDGAPRSATATSLKQSHLVRLDRDDIVDFVNKNPAAALRIIAEMSGRIEELGSHLELLARGRLYARLHDLQSGGRGLVAAGTG